MQSKMEAWPEACLQLHFLCQSLLSPYFLIWGNVLQVTFHGVEAKWLLWWICHLQGCVEGTTKMKNSFPALVLL